MFTNNDAIQKVEISSLDFNDSFFDSLKNDYVGFEKWLEKKSGEDAYVFINDENNLEGFLYLKEEIESDQTIEPAFIEERRLKIGTFKINAHGTALGQRFLSLILRKMIQENYETVYVTLFSRQRGLIFLFEKFGFKQWGVKNNGELVYFKNREIIGDALKDFPLVNLQNDSNKYLLSIYPKYHTLLFPESRLFTERNHFIEDVSFSNSAEKIYLTAIPLVADFKANDLVIVYRTADRAPAEYSSVATSVCTVIEMRNIHSFADKDEYLSYCGKGSIFTDKDLNYFWVTKKYPYIIKMLYNVPLTKRIIRKNLIENVGLDRQDRWSCIRLNSQQFKEILEIGEVNEGFIID